MNRKTFPFFLKISKRKNFPLKWIVVQHFWCESGFMQTYIVAISHKCGGEAGEKLLKLFQLASWEII